MYNVHTCNHVMCRYLHHLLWDTFVTSFRLWFSLIELVWSLVYQFFLFKGFKQTVLNQWDPLNGFQKNITLERDLRYWRWNQLETLTGSQLFSETHPNTGLYQLETKHLQFLLRNSFWILFELWSGPALETKQLEPPLSPLADLHHMKPIYQLASTSFLHVSNMPVIQQNDANSQ